MEDGIGTRFQQETRHVRGRMGGHYLDWAGKPPTYKLYPEAPLTALPTPEAPLTAGPSAVAQPGARERMDVFNAARARRSGRDFSEEPLALMELSLLLLASTGITASDGYSFYRASPSAGALYPIETYVVAHRVSELQPGTYHYRHLSQDDEQRLSPKGGHALEQLRRGDMRRQVAEAALDQTIAAEAAAVFTWTAVFERACWKYRERAYRYVYLDAGHIAAQLSLAAVALGLESCPIAAFYDDELNELLGVDGATESSLYLTVVGRPRKP